jgi:hypothetical protein
MPHPIGSLRAFWVYKETLQVLGIDRSPDFLADILSSAGQTFPVNRMTEAMFNADYGRLLAEYTEIYGADEFIEIVTAADIYTDEYGIPIYWLDIPLYTSRLGDNIIRLIDEGIWEDNLIY